jgi:hypothetical protein
MRMAECSLNFWGGDPPDTTRIGDGDGFMQPCSISAAPLSAGKHLDPVGQGLVAIFFVTGGAGLGYGLECRITRGDGGDGAENGV